MENSERLTLIAELESSQREMRRCIGGIDPGVAIRCAQRVSEIRELLRDNEAINIHLIHGVTHPVSERRSSGRAKRSR